jgi:pimeloyl-ACP methyl ester carboxylesterase
MWEPQFPVLAADYRGISYDIRGHGTSDVGDGQYTIELFVDDLIAVMDRLKIGTAVVVGLSMGGYVALRALERVPERFSAAVLCDTRSESDGNEVKLKRAASIARVKREGSGPFASDFVKTVFAPATLKNNPGRVERIQKGIEGMSPLAIAGTQLALAARTDTTESLSRLSVPVLILVGEHDAITPPDVCRAMQRRIPGSEFYIVPNAAHLSNLENPGFFNEKLLQFLGRVGT